MADMKTYLAYVAGGKCRDTHAPKTDADGDTIKQPRIHKQFWVRDELAELGIEAWCGEKIDFRRLGKNSRVYEAVTTPALQNYIFITMTRDQYANAATVDHISPTLHLLSKADLHGRARIEAKTKEVDGYDRKAAPALVGLLEFKEAVEADFKAAQRVDANQRASVTEYKKGQRLRILSGLFSEMFATFDQMRQEPGEQWPRIMADIDGKKTLLDPIDVRKA